LIQALQQSSNDKKITRHIFHFAKQCRHCNK
jgi:hypothetical protein